MLHTSSRDSGVAPGLVIAVSRSAGPDWNILTKDERIAMKPREQILLTLVILWLLMLQHKQVRVFTYPVKYQYIYKMGWWLIHGSQTM